MKQEYYHDKIKQKPLMKPCSVTTENENIYA